MTLKIWDEASQTIELIPGNWYIEKKTSGDYVVFQQQRAHVTLAPGHGIRLVQTGKVEEEWDDNISSCPINDPHCPACSMMPPEDEDYFADL